MLPISGPQSQRQAEPEMEAQKCQGSSADLETSHVHESRGLMERKENCLVTVWSAVHTSPPSVFSPSQTFRHHAAVPMFVVGEEGW